VQNTAAKKNMSFEKRRFYCSLKRCSLAFASQHDRQQCCQIILATVFTNTEGGSRIMFGSFNSLAALHVPVKMER
jgi:hypothetical protein